MSIIIESKKFSFKLKVKHKTFGIIMTFGGKVVRMIISTVSYLVTWLSGYLGEGIWQLGEESEERVGCRHPITEYRYSTSNRIIHVGGIVQSRLIIL